MLKIDSKNTSAASIDVGIYLFKVNNRNSRPRYLCSKLTIKTPERRH